MGHRVTALIGFSLSMGLGEATPDGFLGVRQTFSLSSDGKQYVSLTPFGPCVVTLLQNMELAGSAARSFRFHSGAPVNSAAFNPDIISGPFSCVHASSAVSNAERS